MEVFSDLMADWAAGAAAVMAQRKELVGAAFDFAHARGPDPRALQDSISNAQAASDARLRNSWLSYGRRRPHSAPAPWVYSGK